MTENPSYSRGCSLFQGGLVSRVPGNPSSPISLCLETVCEGESVLTLSFTPCPCHIHVSPTGTHPSPKMLWRCQDLDSRVTSTLMAFYAERKLSPQCLPTHNPFLATHFSVCHRHLASLGSWLSPCQTDSFSFLVNPRSRMPV